MGKIVAGYDLMPESTDVDLKKIVGILPSKMPVGVSITETHILPVAFGLMKIRAGFVIDDTDETIGSKLEDALRSIKGIENVECVSSTVI